MHNGPGFSKCCPEFNRKSRVKVQDCKNEVQNFEKITRKGPQFSKRDPEFEQKFTHKVQDFQNDVHNLK